MRRGTSPTTRQEERPCPRTPSGTKALPKRGPCSRAMASLAVRGHGWASPHRMFVVVELYAGTSSGVR
eukprot:3155085-Heterocapsa_arctica.AAC.1